MTTVALAGSPNAGKSSLFNALTGSKQKIANYPGVTVEKKTGELKTRDGKLIHIIDLPGIYSLDPQSEDERIAIDVLTKKSQWHDPPDLIVAVADATNLERTLGLVLDLKQLGRPVVMALNMMDLAVRRGQKLDIRKLKRELAIPIVPTIAIRRGGVAGLVDQISYMIDHTPQTKLISKENLPNSGVYLKQRYHEVDRILRECIVMPGRADIISRRIDRVLLHPFFGNIIFLAILILMFQAVFSWAELPMDFIEASFSFLGNAIGDLVSNELLRSLIVDGAIAGVSSVVVFLPQILILFFFIFILEGSGYMMRAAFLTNRLMSLVGLEGRSVVPLLSSFACAIPGMMATRSIKNPKDRLLTTMVAPLMTCSARLPVYVLLIGAFIPNKVVGFGLHLQGLVMFALFAVGILSALIVAWVLQKCTSSSIRSPMIMELPSYKLPNARYIWNGLLQRSKIFLKKAGTMILGVSVVLWFLASFPKPPESYTEPAITYSLAGRIGAAIEPLVRPLGFDWRIATGLVPGFAAREVMVGALGTVFAVENVDDDSGMGLSQLQKKIEETWGIVTGLSLLVWYIFAPQCLATFAVARRETGSWKWTSIMFFYMLALAYIGAFLTFRISNWFLS